MMCSVLEMLSLGCLRDAVMEQTIKQRSIGFSAVVWIQSPHSCSNWRPRKEQDYGENCPEKNAQDGIQGYTYIKAQQESWLENNQSQIEYPGGRQTSQEEMSEKGSKAEFSRREWSIAANL